MTKPVIIADSSPLIALARIEQLNLLQDLGFRVLMPPAVRDEVTVHSRDAPGASEVRQATWIEVEAPDRPRVEGLGIMVGRGEAEAIALSQGLPDDAVLLLDDARARRLAERLELQRIGTVGLLRRAKKAGLIDEIKPHLEALQENGIYIEQALIDAVLEDVGEVDAPNDNEQATAQSSYDGNEGTL
ncbi:MAG: DUF3368 domain-containing protein [bacterium]|nr:DUF3368 domain-containing protein [bacterium]